MKFQEISIMICSKYIQGLFKMYIMTVIKVYAEYVKTVQISCILYLIILIMSISYNITSS